MRFCSSLKHISINEFTCTITMPFDKKSDSSSVEP